MQLNVKTGLFDGARQCPSDNCDERENYLNPEVIIIHCISLPPGQYGSDHIEQFFQNKLDADEHPYFTEISQLTVSSHFLIRRRGEVVPFVSTNKRAWHAGESVCLGRPQVNDFSVGVELEGLDTDQHGFEDEQYLALKLLISALRTAYPKIAENNIFAHSDIAPGRKPDPGPYFNWSKLISI